MNDKPSEDMVPGHSRAAYTAVGAGEYSESVPGAPLEAILCRGVLEQRLSRPIDDARQGRAIKHLLQQLTSAPESVLQSLVETILDTLQCDTAGISLINAERTRFYWPAIAGVLAPHLGGGTPLHFGPCGDVLQAGTSLHMRQVHKRYTYFTSVPLVKEVLLEPFFVNDEMAGTIWAVIHEPPDNQRSSGRTPADFDREDMRMLEVLGDLTSATYKVWQRTRQS